MYPKLIYFFCFVFLAYNLHLLWLDGFNKSYSNLVTNETGNPFNYSICLPFEELKNVTQYHFNQRGLVNSTNFLKNVTEEIKTLFKIQFPVENVDSYIRNETSYVFKKHICFLADEEHLNVVYAFREINYKILFVSNSSKSFFSNSVYANNNKMSFVVHIKISRLIIQNFNDPFNDCVREEVNNQPYSKFNCINDCLKKSDNKFAYYYNLKKDEAIDLTDSERNKKEEDHCYKQCIKESCSLEYFLAVNSIQTNQSFDDEDGKIPIPNPRVKQECMNLDVRPAIERMDWWLQYIGLISLFFDLNLNEHLPGIVRLSILKFTINETEKFKRIFPKFKLVLLFLSTYLFVQISISILVDHQKSVEHPFNNQISLYSVSINTFSLFFCIPVQRMFDNQQNLTTEYDRDILAKYTFEDLETKTNSLYKNTLKRTLLRYGSLENEIKFKVSDKVYFRKSPFGSNDIELISRCFEILVDFEEERYKSLFTNTKLVLEYDGHVAIYIMILNKPFTSDAFLYKSKFQMNKFRIRRINSTDRNCINYLSSEHGCDSRANCLNNCKVQNYLRNHSTFWVNNETIINKDDFKSYLFKYTYFNDENDTEINDECEKLFQKEDCINDLYSESYKRYISTPNKTIINLFFELEVERDIETSWEKPLFAILNVESIIFGVNITKLLFTILAFIKIIFRTKWHRWYKPFVFLICFLGFLIHMYVFFKKLINQELLENGFFEKLNTTEYPDLIYCFEFDTSKIDENHQITGNYLNSLTENELTFHNLFDQISYLNKTGYEVIIQNFTNGFDPNLFYSSFYYLNMKCFQIQLNVTYEERDFLFIEDAYAVKIWLKHEKKRRTVYFTCKKRDTKEFNIFNEFNFEIGKDYKKYKYQIKFEVIQISYDELKIYEYLKNPWSLILGTKDLNDVNGYFDTMQMEFLNDFNLTTKLIVLDKNNSYVIDDLLFEQYFKQVNLLIIWLSN